MPDSAILDTAIGVVLLFATLATLTTALTELVSRFLGLRGAYLLKGIRSLVDGDDATEGKVLKELFGTGVLKYQGVKDEVSGKQLDLDKSLKSFTKRRGLPAYISARSFASGVLALVSPADVSGTGSATMTTVRNALEKKYKDVPFGDQLMVLADTAGNDIEKFRKEVEGWYDDHMDRVSGWYKRHTQWFTALFGVILVVALNVPIFSYAQSLYTDKSLRDSTVSKAVEAADCGELTPAECLDATRDKLQELQPGLSLGWQTVAVCHGEGRHCDFWQRYGFVEPGDGVGAGLKSIGFLLLGWLLTVLALLPGSRFWFDFLNQLNSMRATGPKPAKGASD